jgi:hypothetical protein
MKNYIVIAIAILLVTACNKKENQIKSEDTVIEGRKDTVRVNTDTVAYCDEPIDVDGTTNKAKVTNVPVSKKKPANAPTLAYASFGDKISADKAISKEQAYNKYKNLKPGDSVNVTFKTKINDVCKKKGCWMMLQLPEQKEAFVKFKDYAFFVPLNADGQEAVVSGKAFVSERTVAQLRHYAKDGGKSEEEINKITEPETTYGFLADGVLISK